MLMIFWCWLVAFVEADDIDEQSGSYGFSDVPIAVDSDASRSLNDDHRQLRWDLNYHEAAIFLQVIIFLTPCQ